MEKTISLAMTFCPKDPPLSILTFIILTLMLLHLRMAFKQHCFFFIKASESGTSIQWEEILIEILS